MSEHYTSYYVIRCGEVAKVEPSQPEAKLKSWQFKTWRRAHNALMQDLQENVRSAREDLEQEEMALEAAEDQKKPEGWD